jgi:polysaccharide biosynthesis/export protein
MRVLCALFFLCGLLTSAIAQVEPLHTGDTLQISVWQDPKLDRTVVVGPDGMISFPLAGHIQTKGMTPQALENVLRKRLQKNYTSHLDITVSLAAVNKEEDANAKPRVYITGEVLKPGPYVITRNTNVMQAIALAGGVGPFAASKRIQIHRQMDGKESVFLFDYSAYKAGTDTSDNIDLQSGDVIIVPERGLLE